MARRQRRPGSGTSRKGKSSSRRPRLGTGSVALLLLCASALLFFLLRGEGGEEGDVDLSKGGEWQSCDVFAAPSKLENSGWGVYAARPFESGEVVDLAPLFVPLDMDTPVMRNSAIDDYYYGYRYKDYANPGLTQDRFQGAPALGNTMIFNHHPESNIRWWHLGRVPSNDQPNLSAANGFVAKRRIEAGEELFSSYGIEDGGQAWFAQRSLPLIAKDVEETRLLGTDLTNAMDRFCPKLYSGPGKPNWEQVKAGEMYKTRKRTSDLFYDESRLAPVNAGYGKVFAKVDVKPGDVIESVPALVIPWRHARLSALELLVFGWGHLLPSHQEALQSLRERGYLFMQYQGKDTRFQKGNLTGVGRIERWVGYEDVSLFSLGSIGMVKRVGGTKEEANCRLEIHPSTNLDSLQGGVRGSAGIKLDLVATSSVKPGEVLKLDVVPAGAITDRRALLDEIKRTGQPMPDLSYPKTAATAEL